MKKVINSAMAIMMVLAISVNADAANITYSLTADSIGIGSGSVSSNTGGITYSYPGIHTGSATLNSGTVVNLTATADSGSTVTWMGCDSTGGTATVAICALTMNTDKKVAADYSLVSCGSAPVRILGEPDPYPAITPAYNAAGSGNTVQIQTGDFGEDLTLANPNPVNLSGGYSCGFSPNSGLTYIHGQMIITGGAVTIEKVVMSSGAGFAGTQSPGDFWTWMESTTSDSTISFTASNITQDLNYAGSGSQLTGNSSGISKLTVTSTTDLNVTVPASAYAIEVPSTALLLAPAMGFLGAHAQFSIQPPVFAAAQGSCPAANASLIWITMPSKSWCPVTEAYNPFGNGCASPGNAFGTASLSVSAGTYAITITPYTLDGTQESPILFSACTCSGGVIQCNSNTVRISFTPTGVFFVDTPTDAVVGLVQPDSDINLNDFLAVGKIYKGVNYASLDSALYDVGASCSPSTNNCGSYGGTCQTAANNDSVCASPSTQLFSATTNGTEIVASVYTDIDNGFLNSGVGTISFNNQSQSIAHGLIRAQLASNCGSTDDMVMAVRKINNKYVGLILHHSNCTTFNVGDNALMIEQ